MTLNYIGKRILSLLLLFALLAGMLPVRAMEAETQELVPVRQAESLAVDARTLLDKIAALDTDGGDWNGQVNLSSEGTKINGMRGSYYIVHKTVSNAKDEHFRVLDGRGTLNGDGTIPAVTNLDLPDDTVAIIGGVTPDMAITLVPKLDNGTFSRYLFLVGATDKNKFLDVAVVDGKAQAALQNRNTSGDPHHWISHDSGSTWAVRIRHGLSGLDPREHCLAYDANKNCFHWTNQYTSGSTLTDVMPPRMYLYRLWSTRALGQAIEEVTILLTNYLNAPDTYPKELYGEFLDTLEASVTLFESRNKFPAKASEALKLEDYYQEELDRQTNDLLSYLTLLGSETEYIDIPVEILDFRADNVLFQNMGGFSLRFDYRDFEPGTDKYNVFSQIPELPGTLDPALTSLLPGNNDDYIRTGLTKPKLVNGKPVYEEQTIAHVANGILVHSIKSLSDTVLGCNSKFAEIKAEGIELGSWTDTLGKLVDDRGNISGTNGSHLPWTSVTTAFDLAYYILHYMWSPVPQTNTELLDGEYCYNIPVPERQVMRLYKDSTTGNYLLDAEKGMGYSGKYILNSAEAQPGKTGNSHPCFSPIDGLGFEKPGVMNDNYDTDSGGFTTVLGGHDAVDSNFLFTMHARGAFIYSKEEKQYFNFRGDDDVYFFVNDSIALDMGAAHNRMERGVYLNDIADSLGLVDGETYNFDMFYAERNPSKANLRFETNIQIVSRDGKTTKVQYAHTQDGENLVNAATGLGQVIENRQTVNVGEVVAYGFGILNDQQSPLVNVSFRDDSLGVNISPDGLILCDTENNFRKNNGLETTIDDIRVYYRSHTDGVVTTAEPQELSYDALIEKLDKNTAAFAGSYFVKMENEVQLKDLLQRGIPVGCQMLVYGFLRRTGIEDLNYTNTVKSLCYYIPHGQNTVYPVIGEASCQLRVPENSSLPQVRRLEVVLDYGKAVSVPLVEIPDLIHFEDGSFARVGEVKGFLIESYNGELLKKLPGNLLSAQAGTQFKGVQGRFTVEEDVLTYQPTQFLDRVETLYAVVELQDFYSAENGTGSYPFVVAELRFIPATLMYYETDFAPDSNIFTLTQEGSFEDSYAGEKERYPEWTPIKDGTDSADPNQDYQRLYETVYLTDIQQEYVPAEAFFVDFDGEGYERRYRDNPQYKGLDFDRTQNPYWATQANGSSTAFTIDQATGAMTVQVSSESDSWGNYGPYIATTATPGTYPGTGMSVLALYPSQDYYIQIRFKVENCTFVDGEVPWVHFLYWYTDPATGTIMYDETVGGMDFKTRTMGEYQTLTIPIPADSKFSSANYIRAFGFRFRNIKASGSGASVTIDYIYIGPEMGMDREVYGNYLFFGFDNTPADQLRYHSSVYGSTYRNYDTVDYWKFSTDNNGVEIKNGCLIFEANRNTLDSNGSHPYNLIHAGITDEEAPFRYTPSGNDVMQIRVKIEGLQKCNQPGCTEKGPSLGLEWKKGNTAGRVFLTEEHLRNTDFQVFTIPFTYNAYHEQTVLNYLRPILYHTSGGTFTIDYIYIGPESLLREINQEHDHLFFDFSTTDADTLRYSNPVYGSLGTNYGLRSSWSVDTDVGDTIIVSNDPLGGSITFKDNNDKIWNYIHSAKNYYDTPLTYTPGKNDYLRIRMKIDKGSSGTAPTGIMTVSLENFEGYNIFSYGNREYAFNDYADGEYHIFTVPLNTEDYLEEDHLTAVRPVISGTQGCTFTVDYIYVGPLTESNPAAQSLYFGFGDRGSGHWNTDSLRYDSDTYGFMNYDTEEWISVLPETNSNLYKDCYGWTAVDTTGTSADANPEEGHLELSIPATTDAISIQTYPNKPSTEIYWKYFLQGLNYHPSDHGIVQLRFKTENIALTDHTEINVYVPPIHQVRETIEGQTDAFVATLPVTEDHLTPEGYYMVTALLPDSFCNADSVSGLKVSFTGLGSEDTTVGKNISIDYIYVGPGKIAPEPVYGYDSSYLNDTKLSNGSSYVVTGRGVKTQHNTDKYTEASFSFRGTGFDIISRTDMNQGSIRVEVWKKGADKAIDKAVKTLTVNNKGELDLYQIPVVSVQGLAYGEYDVTLWVNAPIKTPYEFLNHKGNFHFDAVRIYDPMGEDTGLAPEILTAYRTDLEAYSSVKEVRNILLSAEGFASQLTGSGAIFVDSEDVPTADVPATDANGDPIPSSTTTIKPEGITFINSHITASVTTYDKIGPKNEVYLAPGQAVAFMLKISTEYVPTSVDVGVKTIKANEPANLVAGIVKEDSATADRLLQVAGRRDVTIRSATAQYYALPIDVNSFYEPDDNNRYCYIVLYNNGNAGIANVLSVTDIKVAYDKQPEIGLPQDAVTDKEIQKRSAKTAEPYYDFMVDSRTLEAAALVMKAVLETPMLAEGTKLMHSLNLASDISINYAVTKESMADYDSFYLEVCIPGREEALRIDPVENGFYYYFTLEGLTAVQMADVMEATLHMEKDGRFYYSETDRYSIAQYAYTQLNKEGISTELKALCAELLRYGSAAQVFKNYRTDSLADRNMTEVQKAYLTDLEAVTFGNTNRQLEDLSNPTAKWLGKSLILDTKVTLRYIVDLTGCKDRENITLHVRYKDHGGTEQTAILTDAQAYGSVEGYYSFDFSGLLAAELRTVLQAAVYAGDTQISNTLEYSVDTYGNNKTGTLGTLCRALMAYSDAAKAFFAK